MTHPYPSTMSEYQETYLLRSCGARGTYPVSDLNCRAVPQVQHPTNMMASLKSENRVGVTVSKSSCKSKHEWNKIATPQ